MAVKQQAGKAINETPNEIGQRFKLMGLNITAPRIAVLNAFLQSSHPLTQSQVQEYCGHFYNRVTIYRTLNLFTKCGFLHILPSADSTVRYVLNEPEEPSVQNHLHFICDLCHQTYCLHHLSIPPLSIPDQFQVRTTEVVLKGTCQYCLQTTQSH